MFLGTLTLVLVLPEPWLSVVGAEGDLRDRGAGGASPALASACWATPTTFAFDAMVVRSVKVRGKCSTPLTLGTTAVETLLHLLLLVEEKEFTL